MRRDAGWDGCNSAFLAELVPYYAIYEEISLNELVPFLCSSSCAFLVLFLCLLEWADDDETELTRDQFNQLPPSTKQRVTFEQLNEAYSVIKQMYWNQSKKQRKPIAIKLLANKGVKLTGQTGIAVVNCLRTLRLIKSTKQGISCC